MIRDHRIDGLAAKLDQLKREYDLYINGQRRTEPLDLRKDIEKSVMELVRFPTSSTVFKFQVKTLAHRFRSMETQIKNLMDMKMAKMAAERIESGFDPQDIVIDEMAIENPAIIAERVKKLFNAAGLKGAIPADMTPDSLHRMMVSKARTVVGKGNVRAVKYSLVAGDNGMKVKGEIISVAKTDS